MAEAIKIKGNAEAAEKHYQHRTVAPLVDVLENSDEVLIVADVPGVPESAIEVQVENDALTLKTRRTAGAPEERVPALAREYEEVDYARSFRIPGSIETASIRAQSKNGMLYIHLPKAAAAKPRRIEVRSS